MGRANRVLNIIMSLLLITASVIMVAFPETGFVIVILMLAIYLISYGIQKLVYYFTMARHMVGGYSMLIIGILVLDAGLFALSLTTIPKIFVVLYLLGYHAFEAVVGMLRAFEEKKYGSSKWKLKMGLSMISILIALSAVVSYFVFAYNDELRLKILIYTYSAGLVYSAIIRLASTFRRNTVLYFEP